MVFLTNLTSFREQLDKRGEFITEIKTQLEACQREEQFQVRFAISKWDNPRVLSFVLSSRQLEEEVEFDVLPAYDALGEHPVPTAQPPPPFLPQAPGAVCI